MRGCTIEKVEYEWIADGQSIFFVAFILLDAWSLDGDEHVVLIGRDQNLFVFGLDSEEGEVVGGVEVSNHAPGFFGEERDVLGIVIA